MDAIVIPDGVLASLRRRSAIAQRLQTRMTELQVEFLDLQEQIASIEAGAKVLLSEVAGVDVGQVPHQYDLERGIMQRVVAESETPQNVTPIRQDIVKKVERAPKTDA